MGLPPLLHLLPCLCNTFTHLTPLEQHPSVKPHPASSLTLSSLSAIEKDLISSYARLTSTVLSLRFLHRFFHLVGILYRHCQSPVVSEREPGSRLLSLVHPTMLGAQRPSPIHRTVVMRANSLPSHGLRSPALPAVDPRLIECYQHDDHEPREYLI